jgi:hypothetical protein
MSTSDYWFFFFLIFVFRLGNQFEFIVDDDSASAILTVGQNFRKGWLGKAIYGGAVLSRWDSTNQKVLDYISFFNTTAVHGAPIAVNVMNDALSKIVRGSTIKTRHV